MPDCTPAMRQAPGPCGQSSGVKVPSRFWVFWTVFSLANPNGWGYTPAMIRTVGFLIALHFLFGVSSVFCQDNLKEPSSSLSTDRDFDEELPPPRPSSDVPETPVPPAPVNLQERTDKFAAQSQAPAPPPAATILSAKPQAVAAKLAIRDALIRGDAPAARRLFAGALSRFPDDRDLREVRDAQLLRLHDEKIRAIFDRTLADSRKLFGRQWLPGESMDEGESSIELVKTRDRRSAVPFAPGSGARAALADG